MTNRINKNMSSGAAALAEFNRKYTPNTPCFYQPSRNEDKWYPTRTRSEAWMLGHGDVVVKVDGTSGCVAVEHLAMPGSDRYGAARKAAEARNVPGSSS